MASRTPERLKGTLVPTERSLRAIQRDIELSRNEVSAALNDLETAAKELVTVDHWNGVARLAYGRRPMAFLAVAFGVGFIAGRKT